MPQKARIGGNPLSANPNTYGLSPKAYSSCVTRAMAIRASSWRYTRWALLGMALTPLTGCIPDPKIGFDSPAPSKRLDAIVQASELEDDESLVKLVEMLRSHAPAERMLAIRSIEQRTGETLGFDHAAEHWERIAAYNRWLEWLDERSYILPEGMEPIETPNIPPEGSGGQQPMDMAAPEG